MNCEILKKILAALFAAPDWREVRHNSWGLWNPDIPELKTWCQEQCNKECL